MVKLNDQYVLNLSHLAQGKNIYTSKLWGPETQGNSLKWLHCNDSQSEGLESL